MDSDLRSSDGAGGRTSFHKPSNDPSNRKYRRRSPGGSSSPDGEPVQEHSSTHARKKDDTHKKDDRMDLDKDYKRSRHSRDSSSRDADRRSYDDRRHDDYKRREKYNDHSRRDFEQNRSRDNADRYSRDRTDGSGHRNRDKHKRDDIRDEKRSGSYHKDTSWRDSKELDEPKYSRFEKGKSYDQESKGLKDRHFKEPKELLDDKSVLAARKSKFSMDKDTEYSKDANEVQSSSSKQGQEVGKVSTEQDFVKDSDIDAAKIAAMKAAELVNRNLIGTGVMSTDQKKKLLWGSKKSTPAEESAHRWDATMFPDRERQEKFNKLMGVKGDMKKAEQNPEVIAEKQKELQMDLEKQYIAGLRRKDGRTVGLGL